MLTSRALSLPTKGRVYQACVHSKMMYGSETWPVKAEDVSCMEQNDMRMIRWMCNVSVKDRLSSKELRKRLHVDSIGSCMQNRRLCWFGHVERMDKNAWASRCRTIKVAGTTGRGRLKKTWEEVIRIDLKQKGVSRDLVKDRITWKSISRNRPTHATM